MRTTARLLCAALAGKTCWRVAQESPTELEWKGVAVNPNKANNNTLVLTWNPDYHQGVTCVAAFPYNNTETSVHPTFAQGAALHRHACKQRKVNAGNGTNRPRCGK